MDIDAERLRRDLEANAEFGRLEDVDGRGRTVLTGSKADKNCRDRLRRQFEATGLEVSVDPVGNMVGRWTSPGADPAASPVAAGSHLDSVPSGGMFDGPLGVYGALEAVRAMQEAGIELARPIDVVSFTEEEGARFGVGVLGSSVATGSYTIGDALQLKDDDGERLGECLDRIGYSGEDEINPAEWAAWVELHIEQSRQLETAGIDVGIVEAISGLTNCDITIEGEADHAGATPMTERRDALVAAAELILMIEKQAHTLATEHSTATVGTVGRLDVTPNVKNVVPGRVLVRSDFRAVEAAIIDSLVEGAQEACSAIERDRSVTISFDRYRDTQPIHLSDRMIDEAVEATESRGISWQRMHSGAIHDTALVAQHTDATLLFAPSANGISHSPKEWTDWADCARATTALAETIKQLGGE